jgi:hypothetical protein
MIFDSLLCTDVSWPRRTLRCDRLIYEALVMSGGTPAIDAGVGIRSSLGALVAEELSDDFKGSWRGIKLNFGT